MIAMISLSLSILNDRDDDGQKERLKAELEAGAESSAHPCPNAQRECSAAAAGADKPIQRQRRGSNGDFQGTLSVPQRNHTENHTTLCSPLLCGLQMKRVAAS